MFSLMSTRLLITAGATCEPIDAVRYIGNRSSGNLGCQLALAGAIGSYETTLLLAKGSRTPTSHPRMSYQYFTTTRDLDAKLSQHWPSHSVLIMAAAVADFTPRGGSVDKKIARQSGMTLDLVPTHDLVKKASKVARDDQRIIAFALGSPESLEEETRLKLVNKGVDAIVANPLKTMDANKITATVYCKGGKQFCPPPNISKPAFASWLIENLEEICQ